MSLPNASDTVIRQYISMLNVIGRTMHLRRTTATALVVGTWMTFVNRRESLLTLDAGLSLIVKTVLTYLTPLVVSNLILVRSTSRSAATHRANATTSSPSRPEQA